MNELVGSCEPGLAELLAATEREHPPGTAAMTSTEVDPAIPDGLVAHVRSICRSEWLAQQVLDRASRKVLRRLRRSTEDAHRARWAKRWRPEEQGKTRRWLGRLRDEILAIHHLGEVAQHTTFAATPASLQAWRPDSLGRLIVDEPEMVTPSVGVPSYLEQTPPKVLAWVRETWRQERLRDLGNEVSLDESLEPQVWDLTSGSATGSDYFSKLHGAGVIASDLNVGPAEGVAMLDCRAVGTIAQHRGAARHALTKPELVVKRPDIILFDPPSRGRPTHAELYYGSCPGLDLALLSREDWLIVIAVTVVEAVRYLAPGGFLSLLLRCGSRQGGRITEDVEALADLKLIVGDRVRITNEMPIVFRTRRNQISLGQARVPAVHLRVERAP